MKDFGESTTGFTAFLPAPAPATDGLATWVEDGPVFLADLATWIEHTEDGDVDYAVPPFPFILGRISMLRDVN